MKSLFTTLSLTEFGFNKNYIFLSNDAIGNTIKQEGCWEEHITELLVGYIKPTYNCLDIGANFGYHTVTMGLLTKDCGKVFSFEPMRLFHDQVNANAYLNGLLNVQVFNNAVGDTNEHVFIPEPNTASNETINHGDTSITKNENGQRVKMVVIDSLNLPTINFIKLDVQGCELPVLKGAKSKILKDKPVIIVEIEDFQLAKFGYTPQELISFIKKDLEYDMYQMITKYPADFLCVPKNSKINTQFKTFSLKQI
jgi:FkbM family methyltransferase